MIKFTICLFLVLIDPTCKRAANNDTGDQKIDSPRVDSIRPSLAADSGQKITASELNQVIKGITGHQLVAFAQTLLGVPYRYASTDPAKGFDCSGFITYVFNHFNIAVPRSSVDFTNAGKDVNLQSAKEGDLILFTGTVDSIRIVGHMGIVTENVDTLKFIHSTSGKADGVVISALGEYYKRRFVKIIRVLSD
ncbi:MAG TPA: C40 family peptidase [Chitinophagaceae bacterium]|nr:C40 family peptidase [Chitinophagaceae bacterium]